MPAKYAGLEFEFDFRSRSSSKSVSLFLTRELAFLQDGLCLEILDNLTLKFCEIGPAF